MKNDKSKDIDGLIERAKSKDFSVNDELGTKLDYVETDIRLRQKIAEPETPERIREFLNGTLEGKKPTAPKSKAPRKLFGMGTLK